MARVDGRGIAGWRREVARDLRLYRRLAGGRVRGQMQYRTSFLLQVTGMVALNMLELAAIFILFDHFDTLGGWGAGEVAFLYGLSTMSFGLAKVVGSAFDGFSGQIVRGDFDRVLTRPVSPFIQTLCSDVDLRQVGRVIQGVFTFALALTLTDVPWDAGRLLYLPVALLSAALVFSALLTFEATLSFWTVEGSEAINAFTYGGTTLAQYPLHIFDVWLRRLFLWILPLGFVIFLPALYLLDKPDPLGLPVFARFLAPLVAVAFAFVAGFFWRTGVRRYQSTGS